MSDEQLYQHWQQEQEERWEAKCGRCGACCGAFDGDPCEHLRRRDPDVPGRAARQYFCTIYERRFGTHKTLSGKEIHCVPIRQILNASWPGDHCCGYKK